jgi:hypothetical protein
MMMTYRADSRGAPARMPRRRLLLAAAALSALIGACLAARPAMAATVTPEILSAQAAAAASWPHTLEHEGVTVTVYQPQAISWPERKRLTARAALSIARPGQAKPLLGSIELNLATSTDSATGIVSLSDPKLVSSHFPALDTAHAAELEAKIRAALATMQIRQVPLATVLLSLKQLPVEAVKVNNEPPVIFYTEKPASLVVFDGAPVLVPAGKSGLTYAVNTNWQVFNDHGVWFLLNNGYWFSAAQIDGEFVPVAKLPAAFTALKSEAAFAGVAAAIPARALPPKQPVPHVFVSQKPAEVIATAGAPSLRAVTGTGLQRVVNTANILFFQPAGNAYFVLFSGRWFSAHALAGPWTFATDKLPEDFEMISPTGPDAAVLASVPGTNAAQEAVLKAQIPSTAGFKRTEAKLTVVYSGAPQFVPVTGTSLFYAANTNAYVLRVGASYYACEGGAWFVAPAPAGPWLLAESVPEVIYTIPAASPVYPVTYVRVYSVTPAVITFGYTAGYTLGYVSYGVLVYGTGYYYPPVIIPGPVPIFYPYPYTYAGAVWYNPSNGAWARGGTVYGPYGAVSGGTYYNPTTGAYAHGAAVYGPNGGAGAWSAYNPSTGSYAQGSASWANGSGTAHGSYYNARTGVSGSTTQNANPYGRWGSSTFSGANQTVNTQSGANANGRAGGFDSTTGAKGAGYQNNITGGSGGAVKTQGGDVYAGHDGNVYKHTDDGWSKYSNGGWNPVQPPANHPQPPANHPQPPASTTPAPGASPGSEAGRGMTGAGSERGTYQQLDQDRFARQAGGGRWGSANTGSSSRQGGRNRH